MDIDATLTELRELLAAAGENMLTSDQNLRVLDLFEAMDDWLSGGGYLPDAWYRHQRAKR